MFNAIETKNKLIYWIRHWFTNNGPTSPAIIGISGGKDSAIVAALCKEALGKDRVIGIMMPNGEQYDIEQSKKICEYLGIENFTINIKDPVNAFYNILPLGMNLNYVNTSNTPARCRMVVLYMMAAQLNGRVANTCNLSEDYVGYATKFGDGAGDFSPLMELTVTEVKQIGYALGLPKEFIEKVPEDGLSGKTDEDNLGFTYDMLDKFIRREIDIEDESIKAKIIRMHVNNLHKIMPMPRFELAIEEK